MANRLGMIGLGGVLATAFGCARDSGETGTPAGGSSSGASLPIDSGGGGSSSGTSSPMDSGGGGSSGAGGSLKDGSSSADETGGGGGAGGPDAAGEADASRGGVADASGTGGACTNTPGAPFPTVTGYTTNDGGFGPADVTRRTGDASLGTSVDGGANAVAIFRPAPAKYGQGGVRHPLIVWGNGSTNTVDIWQGFLARVATYGFVVVAPEQTQVTADEMNKAIDYVLGLANDPTSKDCGRIDATKVGSTGYSLGGIGAISVGGNARVTSTFVFASNGNVNNLKAPWGVVGGDQDTTFNWTALSSAVTASIQPAFGAALAGINHNQVAGQPKAQQAYIAWLRWRFMNDKAGHDVFVGPNCQICTDPAFSAVAKTSMFDSL